MTIYLVSAVAVLLLLFGLHGMDKYLEKLAAEERERLKAKRRAALLAALGKSPPAPGTMRRRYSDLTEPGDTSDGDQGGMPWHDRDAA